MTEGLVEPYGVTPSRCHHAKELPFKLGFQLAHHLFFCSTFMSSD